MTLEIRQAQLVDAAIVEAMLVEAAQWVDALGEVMWETGELSPDRTAAETAAGQFVLAIADGQPAGAIRFQLEDTLFWPDLPQGGSAFVHRLVVRRPYKGQGISTALLQWAVDRARALGRTHLRLDCDKSRPKLRALYETFGFQFHSFRQVGPYYVARYEYPLTPPDITAG
jgi:GNAT superfamily N-acetyltransferase